MEDENYSIHEREEALARFRESLSKPMSERYFDEDELIDIFDYAGDFNDDYIRLEVLMCAARYYPDSEELLQRKMIFHSNFSDDNRDKCVEDNISADGVIWDVMRAKCANPQTDLAKTSLLNGILDSYNSFNDEELIQFIGLVSYFGQIEWLKENMNKLRSKDVFINVLLYEAAYAAESAQDFDYAVKLLEELTEIEPFNPGFWSFLAKEYAAADQTEKAITAIDYSLAIDPNDPLSLYIKAKLLFSQEKPFDEIKKILKRILEIDDNFIDAVKMLAFIYGEEHNAEAALQLLTSTIDKYPENTVDIIPDMLAYNPSNIDQLLDRFYEAAPAVSITMWNTWAQYLMRNGYNALAKSVIEAYERNSGEKLPSILPIENLFLQKHFSDTISSLAEYLEDEKDFDEDFPSMFVMHLISMIKLGEYAKAFAFCSYFESKLPHSNVNSISKKLEFFGMKEMISAVKKKLSITMDKEDWEGFDPLGLWKEQ